MARNGPRIDLPVQRAATGDVLHKPILTERLHEIKRSPSISAMGIIPSENAQYGNLGLRVLYDPSEKTFEQEPDFDIIAVHGLLEQPDHTWIHPSQVDRGAPDRQALSQQTLSDRIIEALPHSIGEGMELIFHTRTSDHPPQNLIASAHAIPAEKPTATQPLIQPREVNWLTDRKMLQKSFPHARILRFNYGWTPGDDIEKIRTDAAREMLDAIASDRKETMKSPPRPIIFIGHSFGGIVIQTALVLANKERWSPPRFGIDYDHFVSRRGITDASSGIIFLATPFKQTCAIRERWQERGIEVGHQKASELSQVAGEAPDGLQSEFAQLAEAERYRLACFFEKHHTGPHSRLTSVFLDEHSSTLPHYPRIPLTTNHTNMSKFSGPSDPKYRAVIDAMKGFLQFSPTRQLWKLVEDGKRFAIQEMLRRGADPNLRDSDGQNALHKAIQNTECRKEVIEALVAGHADIHAKNREGQTPLFIAELGNRDDIARLLSRLGAFLPYEDFKKLTTHKASAIKRAGNVHPLNKIYMDGPNLNSKNAKPKKPIKGTEMENFDPDCLYACRKSIFSITHFCQSNGGTPDRYRIKTTVYNGLYAPDVSDDILETALPKFQHEHNMVKQKKLFTWYHLPANNMIWVERLLTKIMKGYTKEEIDGALRLLSGTQHQGITPHSYYMRPYCRTVDLTFPSKAPKGKPHKNIEKHEKIALKLFLPYLHYEKASAQATVRGYMTQTADSQNRQIIFNRRPTSKTILLPQTLKSREKSLNDGAEDQNRIDNTAEAQSDMEEYGDFIFSSLIDPPEQYLIGGYLNKEPPLHVRKSLDEFHCIGALDALIGELDMDQIVYKHFEKKLQKDDRSDAETLGSEGSGRETVEQTNKSIPKEHPIIVVDQLWLWIIDSDTVITSFPQACEPSPNEILDRIEQKLNASEAQPNTIGDLAAIIIDECTGFLDRCRAPSNFPILDIFDETISDALKQQMQFFDRFTERVSESSRKEEMRASGRYEGLSKSRESLQSVNGQEPIHRALSIGEEISLLREMRDAREELLIIKHILEEQKRVVNNGLISMLPKDGSSDTKYDKAIRTFNSSSNPSNWQTHQQLHICRGHHQRNVDMLEATIYNSFRAVVSMLERADEVCEGLKTLLDLKQKEANIQEARAARGLAEDNEKQSKMILVFTIVTIIFLPLSFLASFFALNIKQFPRPDQNVEFNLPWVAGLIFGMTAAFVLPCVIGVIFFVSPAEGKQLLYQLLRLISHPFILISSKFKRSNPAGSLVIEDVDPVTWGSVKYGFR